MSENGNITQRLLAYLPYLLAALVLTVVAYVRIRLLAVPLERDEGEFAYMGQLLLKGIPPYVNAYTMKLPGVSTVYALFMLLFGQTPAGIHLGLLIVNGLCIFLLFLLAKRIFDSSTALISCASYAVLSLSISVYGVFAHATHFVVLFSLAGFVLLLRYLDSGRMALLFCSGICFGLAFNMKQHAVSFLLSALLYLLWQSWRGPSPAGRNVLTASALFLLGAVIPYATMAAGMAKAGAFDSFWFWTVQYAREYVSEETFAQGWSNFIHSFTPILLSQLPFWVLALGGTLLLCAKREFPADMPFAFGFLFFSFLSVCPGWYFREHYYIMLLPAVALLTGAGAKYSVSLLPPGRFEVIRQYLPVFLLLAATAYGLFLERENFFIYTPREVSRATFDENPFPEALQVARYIKDRTSPDDRIAVLGSEPEIYFYADRLSATGHIYMYGLMENQPHAELMQQEMIREIETAKPKYIVLVNVRKSWLTLPSSSRTITDWGERHLQERFDLVGVIDIVDSETTRYLWDAKAAGYTPVSHAFLTVFKRKT